MPCRRQAVGTSHTRDHNLSGRTVFLRCSGLCEAFEATGKLPSVNGARWRKTSSMIQGDVTLYGPRFPSLIFTCSLNIVGLGCKAELSAVMRMTSNTDRAS